VFIKKLNAFMKLIIYFNVVKVVNISFRHIKKHFIFTKRDTMSIAGSTMIENWVCTWMIYTNTVLK